jgi:hypothetical protein
MASIGNITFACKDPAVLAAFWASLLGYRVQAVSAEFLEALEAEGIDLNMAAAIIDPEGMGPRLFFEKKDKTPTETAPLHLDINVSDRVSEVRRMVDLGATEVETKSRTVGPYTEVWTYMRDPEGNGFCVQ